MRRLRLVAPILAISCTGEGDDTGPVDPHGVGTIRIYGDAIFAEMKADAEVRRADGVPECVVHVGTLGTFSSAGTLTVGGPMIGQTGAATNPIIVPTDNTDEYVYFGPTFPPTDEFLLDVTLGGSGSFVEMPVQSLRPPSGTAVVLTAPTPPAEGSSLAIPSTAPLLITWTPPAVSTPEHRMFVGFWDIASETSGTTMAGIWCFFLMSEGQGEIPTSVFDLVVDAVGVPASGLLHIGAGDQQEYAETGISYVIEVTDIPIGTDPVLYDVSAVLQ